jgi:hypothetical protein
MNKNFFGGAVINAGPMLPPPSLVPDGALFFKTGANAGLYIHTFTPDTLPATPGNQGSQSWQQLVDVASLGSFVSKSGDTMSGALNLSTSAAQPLLVQGSSGFFTTYQDTSIRGYIGSGSIAGGANTDFGIRAENNLLFAVGSTERARITTSGFMLLGSSNPVGSSRLQITMTNTSSAYNSNESALLLRNSAPGLHTLQFAVDNVIGASIGTTGANPNARALVFSTGASLAAQTERLRIDVNGIIQTSNSLQIHTNGAPSINSAYFTTQPYGVGQGDNRTHFGYNTGSAFVNYIRGADTIVSGTMQVGGVVTAPSFNGNATSANSALVANNANNLLVDGNNYRVARTISDLANSVMARDGAGYAYAVYFNQASANNENSSVSQVLTTNGSDNFLRKVSIGHLGNNITTLGTISTLGGISAPNGVFRMTPNLHLNSGSGSAVIVNWDNGNGGNPANWAFRVGNGASADVAYITYGGSMGINGSFIANGNITANGNVTAFGSVSWTSDRRLKEDIQPIIDASKKVAQLNGVVYTRKGTSQRATGLIAQDVQKVAPEAVVMNEDGYLSVAYGNLVGLLVEAIKDQQKQIDDLQRAVADVQAKLGVL